MRKDLRERLGKEYLFCDGGTGTFLQEHGLQGGELPETWNVDHPDVITQLYEGYLNAGSDIFNTNTFGLNSLKFPGRVEELMTAAVVLAKQARINTNREDAYIAVDIGPTGKLLEPMGDLSFDRAVELFGEAMSAGEKAGGDLILIETMSDSYEAKAAVLAAKEYTKLPVIVTTVYDQKGKMLTGGNVDSTVAMLEGLGVDALGMNCGMGPDLMKPMVERMVQVASVPIVVNPNAGLPRTENGKTVFDVTPEEFSDIMCEIADMGVQVLGGCCGTTPEHIRQTVEKVRKREFHPNTEQQFTVITSLDNWNKNDKLIVISGTTAETYVTKNYPNIPLQKYDTYANAKNALENGNGAAWLNDNTEVLSFAKSTKGFTVGIPTLGSQDKIAPAVTKGNSDLKKWIDNEIKSLNKEDFFSKDYDKTLASVYGKEYKSTIVIKQTGTKNPVFFYHFT